MINKPGFITVCILSALMVNPGVVFSTSHPLSGNPRGEMTEKPTAVSSTANTPSIEHGHDGAHDLSQHLLETAYKRYSLYRYKDIDVLCEPYTVKKGDWIYQIFRTKGELSAKDFPLFLNIFKEINPDIKNMDHIRPGQLILIPLKRTNLHDFNQSGPGVVDVPIIKLSQLPDNFDAFVDPHTVTKGDNVSNLLHPDFLNRDKSISSKGRFAFFLVNPKISSLDLIVEESTINIPKPNLLKQPWFDTLMKNSNTERVTISSSYSEPPQASFTNPSSSSKTSKKYATLSNQADKVSSSQSEPIAKTESKQKSSLKSKLASNVPKALDSPERPTSNPPQKSKEKNNTSPPARRKQNNARPLPLKHLKRLSNLNGGRLLTKGNYFFPGNQGEDIVLDLTQTPLIRMANGKRILFVPDKKQYALLTHRLITPGRGVKVMDFNELSQVLSQGAFMEAVSSHSEAKNTSPPNRSASTKNTLRHPNTIVNESLERTHKKSALNRKTNRTFSFPLTTEEDLDPVYVPIQTKLPKYPKSLVSQLMRITGYSYVADAQIKLPIDRIEVPISAGIVTRSGRPDTVIFFGNVYGATLDTYRKRSGSHVFTLSSTEGPFQTARELFSTLGASITRNPSFISPRSKKAISLPGIFIDTPHRDIFISTSALLLKEAFDYLSKRQIRILTPSS